MPKDVCKALFNAGHGPSSDVKMASICGGKREPGRLTGSVDGKESKRDLRASHSALRRDMADELHV